MKVMLFGILAELAGNERLEIDARTTTELRDALREHINQLDELSYAIAIDRKIVHAEMSLRGDEEIAVLPPFAGG